VKVSTKAEDIGDDSTGHEDLGLRTVGNCSVRDLAVVF
jgi:hypothetical protein